MTLDVLGILPAGGMTPACLDVASFAMSTNFLSWHLAIDDVSESINNKSLRTPYSRPPLLRTTAVRSLAGLHTLSPLATLRRPGISRRYSFCPRDLLTCLSSSESCSDLRSRCIASRDSLESAIPLVARWGHPF